MIAGIGVDITEIKRIKQAVQQYQRTFLRRVFTPEEIRYCIKRKKNPYQHLAARFAAKEAFMKAIGTGWAPLEVVPPSRQRRTLLKRESVRAPKSYTKSLTGRAGLLTGWGSKQAPAWKDIEIKKSPRTPPLFVLSGRAKKICDRLKVKKIHLSLSHSTDYAVAIVILDS